MGERRPTFLEMCGIGSLEPGVDEMRAERDALKAQLGAAMGQLAKIRFGSGCGDGHCLFSEKGRKGVHTNGGCSCLHGLPGPIKRKVERAVFALDTLSRSMQEGKP